MVNEMIKDHYRTIVILAILAFGLVFFFWSRPENNLTPNSNPAASSSEPNQLAYPPQPIPAPAVFVSSELIAKEILPPSIPEEFFKDVPLYPRSQMVRSTVFSDPISQKVVEAEIELETLDDQPAVLKFYQDQLQKPDFRLLDDSDQKDADSNSYLIFNTSTGMLIVRFSQKDARTSVVLREVDLLRGTAP